MAKKTASLIATESLSEQIAKVLAERIITGVIPPGVQLGIVEIAEELEVSRTPVREALAMLAQSRLIHVRPRIGSFVAKPDTTDIREICQLRLGLEWVSAAIAAESMPIEMASKLCDEAEYAVDQAVNHANYEPFFLSDGNIHNSIAECTGNTRLQEMRTSIEYFTRWLAVLGATSPKRISKSTGRHLEVLNAIRKRDVDGARTAMYHHIKEVEADTIEDMEEKRIYG